MYSTQSSMYSSPTNSVGSNETCGSNSSNASANSNGNKNAVLMNSLHAFFQDSKHIQTLLRILKGESKISLRVVDWFVTNYSKKKNIAYLISNTGNIIFEDDDVSNYTRYRQFVVYIDYKLQLKKYQKKQFDPFCRRQRIEFYYRPNECVLTTVGQLNFFIWAISNNIIEYIEKHLKVIETDMNTCYKAAYKKNTRVKSDSSLDLHSPSDFGSANASTSSYSFSNGDSTSENMIMTHTGSYTSLSTNSVSPCVGSEGTGSSRRKRQELSSSATKTMIKSHVKVVVSFD